MYVALAGLSTRLNDTAPVYELSDIKILHAENFEPPLSSNFQRLRRKQRNRSISQLADIVELRPLYVRGTLGYFRLNASLFVVLRFTIEDYTYRRSSSTPYVSIKTREPFTRLVYNSYNYKTRLRPTMVIYRKLIITDNFLRGNRTRFLYNYELFARKENRNTITRDDNGNQNREL